MDVLQTTVDAVSDLIAAGLKPIPSLLGYSLFDIGGALRLGLVLRQIREAERAKAKKMESKSSGESGHVRQIENQGLITDLMTTMVVVYGGEMICSPWLQFTPSFLTMPRYPLLFAAAQAVINLFPIVPMMSIATELPCSLFDGLTRVLLLTMASPGLIVTHTSSAVSSSPWALLVVSLIMANGGFFLVNVFQMLSPYGWHVATPPEILPGGWRSMDLWVAPLITGVHALLTHSQAVWIPYHRYFVQTVGTSTIFGTLEHAITEEGEWKETTIKPVGEAEARSICALVLCALFAYRAVMNFGMDWGRTSDASQMRRRRVIRSKHDGKRLPRDNLKVSHKSG